MIADPLILLVDLNNFARYPTVPIGYLAAVLRKASMRVSVFAPLMLGVHGTTRESRPGPFSLAAQKINYLLATSSFTRLRRWRNRISIRRLSGITAKQREIVDAFAARLQALPPQAVMISTYLMYRDICVQLCAICRDAGIPVLVGGPYFSQRETIAEWIRIPGLSALAAGEVELQLPAIARTLIQKGDLGGQSGIFVSNPDGKPVGRIATPLPSLDAVPFPDYTDFPWQAYPNRIVPIITGRGCEWGRCRFCSDITSCAGRSFRSRSPDNVLREIGEHHRRHGVDRFVFTDLKLNSSVDMWRSIIAGIQDQVPDSRWIGAIHVDTTENNGLSKDELRAAAKSGCARLTTGLESGSQRILDSMKKGTRLDSIGAFLLNASAAGISCRCTMILGYPGETAEDVQASTNFLARHSREIERVSLNRLQIVAGTSLHGLLKRTPQRFGQFRIVSESAALAQVEHRDDTFGTAPYRKSVMGLLSQAHRINSRNLSLAAREFEGVM